ncbi:MAG: hypothetical protein MK185_09390 [Saccharospirillaceae bacterium]|nr:hypothetical protein A3759_05210 [Thalassolituus sp. HI0120]MCH2040835.1 hypothetical protein [Saccharospirillaceae bacterium]
MNGKGKKLLLLAAVGATAVLSPLLYSQPGNEAYYSTEIDDAVAHAKRNPVDKRYVGSTWYNRSTSKSFRLPKMLNTEMNDQVIEGAVGATAAGDEAVPVVDESVTQINLGRTIDNDSLKETRPVQTAETPAQKVDLSEAEVYIPITTYSGQGFSGTATDIRSNVRISAEARP